MTLLLCQILKNGINRLCNDEVDRVKILIIAHIKNVPANCGIKIPNNSFLSIFVSLMDNRSQ